MTIGRCYKYTQLLGLVFLGIICSSWDVWNVQLEGRVNNLESVWGIGVIDEIVYTADSEALRIYDMSQPNEPDELGRIEINAMRAYPFDDLLIVSLQNGGLAIYDISRPEIPGHLSTFESNYIFN